MEAFLDHAHHQLKVLKEALPKLAADKDSKKELDTLKGVISVGEDALEKIERDTVIDDAQSRHEKVKDELSDEELGLSDKFKVFKGNQLRQKASASQHGVGLLDVQPDSVLNIDSSDEAVWAPGGDPFKSIGQPSFHSRSAQHPAAARAHYENSQAAMSEMDSYFASLNRKTQQENRKNARRAGEGVGEVHERDQRALDHSTQKLRLGKGMQQLKAAAPSKHQQALRFIKALSSVLSPQQLQQLKSSSDSCGMCIAVMGCEDCCELFCTDEQNSAASTNKIPKCPLSGGDAGGDSGCDDSEVAATSDVSKLEGDMKDLKKQLKVTSELDQAQHAALEAEIKDVSTHITSALQSAKGTAAATKSARAAPCDCTTQECKECPESDYDARARYSAAQEKQRLDKEYPAADAQKFKILFKKAVQEAGIAAVKEAVKEEKTQEQSKVEEAVKKEMKALKAQMTKTKRMPCECDSADCGNCPDKHVEARKGKAGGRGRAAASRGAKAVDPDKVAKAAAENRALKKAELAVAKSNAILQVLTFSLANSLNPHQPLPGSANADWYTQERVAALEATNAIAIRQVDILKLANLRIFNSVKLAIHIVNVI